jgi:hypothetical protein
MSGLNPAGERNRTIVLQTATITQNPSSGENVVDWTAATQVTLRAKWMPAGTREAFFAQQRLDSHIDGVFRIPYRDRPDPALNRILWEGRTYDLKPAIERGFREGWDVPVVAQGANP